ncbi:MAG: UDP-N-acetylmuramate dehydrogenase [Pseudomonadota bacterium]
MVYDLTPQLRGTLRFNEPLSAHTTWRVGGPADRYYQPADLEDLCAFLAGLPANEPLFWMGLGSNLLVRDGGFRGTVIAYFGGLNRIELQSDGRVYVEAGVACAKTARFCARAGLVGAEFLAGIPGAMGGALAMNAGAFGGETWNIVDGVETVDHAGERTQRTPRDFRIGYRTVVGPAQEWFTGAWLKLARGDAAAASKRIKELLERRSATQPTQLPNAGSVFRNPPGDYAGRLIEACGLKGTRIGGACVSEKHANFIINEGNATAADIEQLITRVTETVQARHDVHLECEVRIVGEPGGAEVKA